LWKSELAWSMAHHVAISSGVLVGAIVCALLTVRFALCPFFSGMDMELKSPVLRFLCAVPTFVGVLAILVGISGMVGLGSVPMDTAAGVELLKSVLLSFVVAVTIIVVAVPEGLPMMVTVSLALNMMKMAKQNCLVRKLVASETIGSATVICTDKTGTLTQNRMRPVWIFTHGQEYTSDQFGSLQDTTYLTDLIDGIALNSTADLHVEQAADPSRRTVTGIGNPTECSLLMFLDEQGVNYRTIRESRRQISEVAHQSERKFSATVSEHSGERICHIKGAPERILAKCSTISVGDREEPIDAFQEKIQSALRRASDQALRVLAFARKTVPSDDGCEQDDPERIVPDTGMVFTGMIGIADPIREEVPAAVQMCQEAGVQVKMVTGDSLPTAVAIARQAGIYHDQPDEKVMTSEDFQRIPDEKLRGEVGQIRVLARSTPMDKLRIVKALHQNNVVVAMTGDGTNDAPALKSADVGLSMGITGTEVAREASDIVLVDDNFRSIVTGIWWGRTLFQNIQRFLQFQLSVNGVALLCALIGPLVGVPLPLTVTQLLWINIIMDTFAALALSTDP
ncbi:MAG: HAD-IC family P-type ATPase, partial [Planctomycetia bacterium]|nr:HAD-IC family P-type ATPase [Planctomycetia bacterium]